MLKQTSTLAFLGSRHAFNYYHIGGTDSLVRRLAKGLVLASLARVDFVLYGFSCSRVEQHYPGMRSIYCLSFEEAMECLKANRYKDVLSVYILPRDRLSFAWFRKRYEDHMRFHMLYPSWPDSTIKRWLMFTDARMVGFNGRLFGISPRLVKHVSRWDTRATLLWPPVPSNYFIPLSEKTRSARTRVTYLGRVDPGKGVIETIKLFNVLAEHPNVELLFCGMHWPHDPASVRLHRKLLEQKRFRYVHVDYNSYSDSVDDMVRSILRDTDILVQPYRRLSSTIDTPMLILEAMASLTAVITKAFGDIPYIYGKSICLVDREDVVKQGLELILSAGDWLPSERARIDQQNKRLAFDVGSVLRAVSCALGIGQD